MSQAIFWANQAEPLVPSFEQFRVAQAVPDFQKWQVLMLASPAHFSALENATKSKERSKVIYRQFMDLL